tara:strand:+ start:141 stop:536 length:396 start_codon:yes stop_codon:yes gene_type:complete
MSWVIIITLKGNIMAQPTKKYKEVSPVTATFFKDNPNNGRKLKDGTIFNDRERFIPDVMSKYCEQFTDTTMISFRVSKAKLNHLKTLIDDEINPLLKSKDYKEVTVSSVLQILLYDEINKLGGYFDEYHNR